MINSERRLENEPKIKQPHDLTIYVLRHAETISDKMNPKRGLTEKGEEDCLKAAQRIINELNPERDVINLLYSGMDRADKTLQLIAKTLHENGFKFFLPEKTKKIGGSVGRIQETAEIRTRKHLAAENIRLTDEYRKKLYDTEYKMALGLPADAGPVSTWLSDEGLPEGVETQDEVTERLNKGIAGAKQDVEKYAQSWREQDKRIVAITITHGGVMEKHLSTQLGIKINELGEIDNLEGFKITFDLNKNNKVESALQPWGENIEKKLEEIK